MIFRNRLMLIGQNPSLGSFFFRIISFFTQPYVLFIRLYYIWNLLHDSLHLVYSYYDNDKKGNIVISPYFWLSI